jgi:hypothetical protein
MTAAEKLYTETGLSINGVEQSQMFGKPCFKVNEKAFCCFFEDEMVFKLEGKTHESALGLKGSQLFDPSGKKRPMKEWVQVPFAHKAKWAELAKSALKYVKSNT